MIGMSKKKLWLLIILTALLVGTGWLSRNKNLFKEKKEEVRQERIETEKTGQVDLVLDFGKGKVSTYSANLDESATVFEILSQLCEENDLNLVAEDSDFGVFVKQIGKKGNTKDLFWLYFVNGKMAEVAADKYELKEGDLVEWKYQKMKP